VIASLAVFASTADAATQVGQTFTPDGNCSPRTRIQLTSAGNSYVVPTAGVLTSWSFERSSSAGGAGVKLKVARAVGGDVFSIVGESALENPPVGLSSYPTQVPVQPGDVLGLYTSPPSVFYCSGAAPGGSIGTGPFGSDPPPGTDSTFPASPNQRLSVSAMLEPDCDADGLGDESQDADTLSCPPGPQATITRAPKDRVKTKRKRKRVTFEFSSLEPATFECSLDGAVFAACSSPYSAKVRRGKHRFEVRGVDAGGNPGPSAVDTWKVKRKPKRR
jgi:hypothetical protein